MATDRTWSNDVIAGKDLTAPFYELQSFDSIFSALQWKQVRARVPVCVQQLLQSRYMLANLVYLLYSIGILILNFHPNFNRSTEDPSKTTLLSLDQPINSNPILNHYYLGFACLHIVSAFLYWWAWRDRSWFDVVMIPEYLNHVAAGLYLWSAWWYPKQDTLGGNYTLAVHKIELTAAFVEVIASFGWIMSWYLSYTRTLGRGFTLDDPDTMAYLTTTSSSFIYLFYNIQINLYPEQYGTNMLYKYGDILYFVGAYYYAMAAMRDENCFWFLPLAGQYGVAPGKIQVDTKLLPQFGKSPVLITDCCRQRRRQHQNFSYRNDLNTLTMTNPMPATAS